MIFFDDYRNIPWLDFKRVKLDEPYYEYYYAEGELYLIHDRISEAIWFVEARSPKQALSILKDRWACMSGGVDDADSD